MERQERVMKLVRCRDHGFDCKFEAHGTEEEVLQQTAGHATSVHHLQISEDLVKAVKAKMKEIPAPVFSELPHKP